MSNARKAEIMTTVLLLALAAASCKGSNPKSGERTEATTSTPVVSEPEPSGPVTMTAFSTDARQRIERVFDAYETIRAALARDDITGATASAEALEKAAESAEPSAPQKLRPELLRLAAAAAQLKKMAGKDASEVRRQFGQVSEAAVAILSIEPALREGRYLFECPMAQGYKKWVQSSSQVSNPYMGTQMLRCGSSASWNAT